MSIKLDYRPNFINKFDLRLNEEGRLELLDLETLGDSWTKYYIPLRSFSMDKMLIDQFKQTGSISEKGMIYLFQLRHYIDDIPEGDKGPSDQLVRHFKATIRDFFASNESYSHLIDKIEFEEAKKFVRRREVRRKKSGDGE